ncbi:glycine cleavage T C-terminal barrel domain-containing protein [soil metagenome]
MPKPSAVDPKSLLKGYSLLRDTCGRVSLPDHAAVFLLGEDRKGWLQGQATQNLRPLGTGGSTAFCFCEATGQMVTIAEAWELGDRIAFTVPRATLDATLARIEQMTILEDVVAEVADGHRVISIQGPQASAELSKLFNLPQLDAGRVSFEGEDLLCLRSNRTGMGGWDLWIPTREAEMAIEAIFPEVAPEAYEVARIEAGIPKWGADATSKTLPPELGPVFLAQHVSHSKGCYVGQEVLQRIHSRGHVNRVWVGLIADRPIPLGSRISHLRREDVGTVTSAGNSPDFGFLGAAIVRQEAAFDGESVRIHTEEESFDAEVRPMPVLRFA